MTDVDAVPSPYRMGRELTDEMRDALEATLNATVGTVDADGSVNLANVWFLFEGGKLYYETASTTAKARNVAERGVVTMLIAHPEIDVRAAGRGRVIRGKEAQAINQRLRSKYAASEAQDAYFRGIDDCAVEISVERWRSWTNTELRRQIADSARPGSYPAAYTSISRHATSDGEATVSIRRNLIAPTARPAHLAARRGPRSGREACRAARAARPPRPSVDAVLGLAGRVLADREAQLADVRRRAEVHLDPRRRPARRAPPGLGVSVHRCLRREIRAAMRRR